MNIGDRVRIHSTDFLDNSTGVVTEFLAEGVVMVRSDELGYELGFGPEELVVIGKQESAA